MTITGFGLRDYLNSKNAGAKAGNDSITYRIIGAPEFKMEVAATYPLEDNKEPIKTITEAKKIGKVLFRF